MATHWKLLVLAICIWGIIDARPQRINNGKIQVEVLKDDVFITIFREGGKPLKKSFGKNMPYAGTAQVTTTEDELRAVWSNGLELSVTPLKKDRLGASVKWTSPGDPIQLALDLGDYNWYGGCELYNQPWPIQNQSFSNVAFVPGSSTGAVLDGYFLSTESVAYYLDHTQPLFVELDDNSRELKLTVNFSDPYRNTDGRNLTLTVNYITTPEADLISTHIVGLVDFLHFPTAEPAVKVISNPIWSTWAKYKSAIDQDTVLAFAQEIHDNGFSASQIEIDDKWEPCYGAEEFDSTKFPDPKGLVDSIKALGYDVTVWVTPFINTDCYLFDEADSNGYLVKSYGSDSSGIVSWWNGEAGIIDITNPDAASWWAARLQKLQTDIGITAFKFDAGETEYLPTYAALTGEEDLQPGLYSTEYSKFAAQFGGQVEARIGYGSQDSPIFVRILDRDSRWGLDNGLHSVITSTLHFGILGYPYVLPDYIGGNAYGTDYPDRELFIRWAQANVFLPVMQFSITPWSYDDEVTAIIHNLVELHYNLTNDFLDAAQQSTYNGYPINRPIWWIDPKDPVAQTINDEFTLGSRYLIAPVIEQGATSRDIYLPSGDWFDKLRNNIVTGPIWLYDYEVQLDELPYFVSIYCDPQGSTVCKPSNV